MPSVFPFPYAPFVLLLASAHRPSANLYCLVCTVHDTSTSVHQLTTSYFVPLPNTLHPLFAPTCKVNTAKTFFYLMLSCGIDYLPVFDDILPSNYPIASPNFGRVSPVDRSYNLRFPPCPSFFRFPMLHLFCCLLRRTVRQLTSIVWCVRYMIPQPPCTN